MNSKEISKMLSKYNIVEDQAVVTDNKPNAGLLLLESRDNPCYNGICLVSMVCEIVNKGSCPVFKKAIETHGVPYIVK